MKIVMAYGARLDQRPLHVGETRWGRGSVGDVNKLRFLLPVSNRPTRIMYAMNDVAIFQMRVAHSFSRFVRYNYATNHEAILALIHRCKRLIHLFFLQKLCAPKNSRYARIHV